MDVVRAIWQMLQRFLLSANNALSFRTHAVPQPRAAAVTAGPPPKLLIVGLGNPGARYAHTRHNIGFDVLDELARSHNIQWNKKLAHKALVAQGSVHGVPVVLCKPMTFMNVSGESVAPLTTAHGLKRSQVLVVFDDLDSDFGAVKLKQKGGHGGHNGMRSIIQWFGGDHGFPRLKIGIGRPANPSASIPDHVLGRFAGEEAAAVPGVVAEATAAVEAVCALGLEVALSGKRLDA
eukprot:jgi/Ulvmu1/2773/UM140_0002.1